VLVVRLRAEQAKVQAVLTACLHQLLLLVVVLVGTITVQVIMVVRVVVVVMPQTKV
jgi:hypothetical protein